VLAPPWPTVVTALDSAGRATGFAHGLFVLYLGLALVAVRIVPTTERRAEDDLWVEGVALVLLVPALIHLYCQWVCSRLPHSSGGGLAAGSLWMLVYAPLAFFGLVRDWHLAALLFAFCGAWAVVIALGLWLVFLVRLGVRLGDDELCAAARSFIVWYWFGFVLALVLLGASLAGEFARSGAVAWLGKAGAGAVGVLLLRRYKVLLRVATSAVARRAPERVGS
jgi:hypothetical protein